MENKSEVDPERLCCLCYVNQRLFHLNHSRKPFQCFKQGGVMFRYKF